MQSNLNPGQLARARPMSASLRTPRGNPSAPERLRDGQAIPRLAPRPEEAPPGEDEPWLFAFPRCLTTADLWKMGFAQAIMFNAAGWTNEAAAAAEISSALRRAVPLPSLSAEHREDVEGAIAPSFMGGDVVIAVACHGLDNLPPDDREQCVACMAVRPRPHPHPHPHPHPRPHSHPRPSPPPVVAHQGQARSHRLPDMLCVRAWQKLVDCISSVWSQYDALENETLGAVVVVLEGCGLHVVSADWGDGEEPMAYPVTPLDESLAPYFA